jgi:hypothetical protein
MKDRFYRNEFYQFGHMFFPATKGRLYLSVMRWVRKEGNHTPLLSPDLGSEVEIDEAIDDLIKDLEVTRRRAKTALKRHLQKLDAAA